MNPLDHLQGKLTNCTAYQQTDADDFFIEKNGIEAFIYKTLTNKKFRKWAIDASTQDNIKQAIRINVQKNDPIQLTFPFGAYKLWRLPSSPEVDWAEFFAIAYYSSYVAPILATYQPGIQFSFWSDDIVVQQLNNIAPEDTKAYRDSLGQLIHQFHRYVPSNFNLEFRRVADLYPDRQEYERDVALQLPEAQRVFSTLPIETQERMLRMSTLNLNWNGVEDLTHLSAEEREQRIQASTILHDAYRHIPRRRAAVRSDRNIVIFSDPIANSIGLGSSSSSQTKFWTGFGVLEQRQDRFVDRVLSPEQFEKMKDVEHAIVQTDLIPLKNFSEIRVYDKKFEFGM